MLTAFVAVEDQLATIRSLAEQDGQRRAASADADRTEQLTLNQYLQGSGALIRTVVTVAGDGAECPTDAVAVDVEPSGGGRSR